MPFKTPPPPSPPTKPTNALHDVGSAIGTVASAPGLVIDAMNTGFASATNVVANALPSFPAAVVGSLAVGIPHAHIAHPPSGPPPIPPTPLPPIGTTAIGCCVQVLIGGMPAARAGDLGLSPTCCGIPPLFEHFTGSSNVFIGGARAARMLDMTWHCRVVNNSAMRGTSMAMNKVAKAAQMAMLGVAVAGMASQALMAAGDAYEAVEADSSAMSAALATNAAMMTAQLAVDAVAMATANAMGKDPQLPPTGTMGTITFGMPNVLIGGFPMPQWMDIAKGIIKMAKKGLKGRARRALDGMLPCGC